MKSFMVVCNGKAPCAEPRTPKRPNTTRIINWELCILYQEDGRGLQCQYADNKVIIGSGYKSLMHSSGDTCV